ncbi:hypothetical protein D3C78_1595020 [compost metagenome]
MGDAKLAHQGQPIGAHHLIEEVSEGGLELADFLAPITVLGGTGAGSEQRGVRRKWAEAG